MRKILYLVLAIALFAGCETDLKLTGEYEDITIVYGLLNPSETEHILRIQKGFLGEQSATVMSAIADSNYYDTTKIVVKLVDSDNNEILFHAFQTQNKDTGSFYYGQNEILYKATANLNTSRTYNLVIEKNEPLESTTSTTKLVKDFSISKPDVAEQATINFVSAPGVYLNSPVQWQTAANAIRHQLTLRFYYREFNTVTLDTVSKYLDWIQPYDDAPNANGGSTIQKQLAGEDFYRFIKSNLENVVLPENVVRLIGRGIKTNGLNATDHLDFIINVAGEDFYNYLELNKPSEGLVQEKPLFTNITNGLGVFSTRFQKSVANKRLKESSVDELKTGQYTGNLKFVQEED